MMTVNAILSADKNWGIGRDGGLLFHIPEDMRFFKAKTVGHTVIMGRATYESLPGRRPLPDRRNIILSSSLGEVCGAEVAHSLSEALSLVSGEREEDVFVIGGGAVYSQLLPLCSRAYVTRIDAESPADVHFPDLDRMPQWRCTYESEPHYHAGLTFRFTTYENGAPARSEI